MKLKTTPPSSKDSFRSCVVLYKWDQCGHCTSLMPHWRRAVDGLKVPVYLIDVDEHREALHTMGVELGDGVPRMEVYNAEGEVMVYEGARDTESMSVAFRSHLLTSSPGAITPPALVLYFRHSCGFCVRFLPEFVRFADGASVRVYAVDTSKHPNSLGELDAPANSVPHILFHGTEQIEFKGDRTVEALNKFVDAQTRGVSFKGGMVKPVSGSVPTRLGDALDRLQEKAVNVLGKKHARAFEPEHASVYYVGIRKRPLVDGDRIYILFCPNKTPHGKPPVMAAVYGPRTGKLISKIYVDKHTDTLLASKRSSGFTPVLETNPFVQHLQTFGYRVEFS